MTLEAAIEAAAKAIAYEDGMEAVFSAPQENQIAQRSVDSYRRRARAAVSTFIAEMKTERAA